MRHYNSLLVSIPALLFTGALLSADSLTVQLTGVGPSDGQYYVLPYQLSVDGVETAAICYDFQDEISLNQTWSANELSLGEVQNDGQFSGLRNASYGYEEVAWLSSLWFTETLTTGDQIDLQHAIWDVFDPGAFNLPHDPFLNAVQAEEASGVAGLNYADYEFLEPISESGNRGQAFVLYDPGNNQHPAAASESGGAVLLSIGLLLIGISSVFHLGRAGTLRAGARGYIVHFPFTHSA